MHELSLAQAMVEQLEDYARREGAQKIVTINLVIGAMSGVERDPFEFVFPLVAEGTVLEKATLHFEEVPVKVKCRECGKESLPPFPIILCSSCSSRNVEVIDGEDFSIQSMEIL